MARDLPAEAGLRELARRFADAERRVRLLLEQAPNGNRRALLTSALLILAGLRKELLTSEHHVVAAYAHSAAALHRLTGMPIVTQEAATPLGVSLKWKLQEAVALAEQGSREAFATVTADNTPEKAAQATIGAFRKDGSFMPLGAQGEMLTNTIGRRAVSKPIQDMGFPMVEIAEGTCTLCAPVQGEQPAYRQPPFHPNCKCIAVPLGYSAADYLAAM